MKCRLKIPDDLFKVKSLLGKGKSDFPLLAKNTNVLLGIFISPNLQFKTLHSAGRIVALVLLSSLFQEALAVFKSASQQVNVY